MKKFLIAGSSLAAVAAAGSAGAVDVTLGGSIDMGIDFGLGKENSNLILGSAYNEISLSLSAAGTTDGGLMFGGSFTLGTATEIEFNPYASAGGAKFLAQKTNDDRTDILGNAWNVSGGAAVDVADIVSVKINSNWVGVDSDAVQNIFEIETTFTSSAICKIAGKGTGTVYYSAPAGSSSGASASAAGGYLPAGQLMGVASTAIAPGATGAGSSAGTGATLVSSRGAVASITQNATIAAIANPGAPNTANITTYVAAPKGAVDFDGSAGPIASATARDVDSAAIYAGPFMEVMMASSSTKMVVGALCLDGNDVSATMIHMNNASKVMTVSNASIYIDGGFGRLTLQSSDYAGGVSAIAGAGDQANIDAEGIVVIAQGLGILGANPYIAVDLADGSNLGDLEVITGGTIDLGGLSAAVDVALDNPTDVFGVSAWDLGLTYAMGDMSLAAAIDSSNDWGLSASMAIAGFGVSTTFGSSTAGDHAKSGITYSVSASTALNGFGLAVGFDQDLQPTVGVNYDLGGLVLSAGYDAGEGGGSLGATLSF